MPPDTRLFSHCYLGPVGYFRELIKGDALIEVHDHYQRQTWQNRCRIQGPNGLLDLSIPIRRFKGKKPSGEVEISYDENWQDQHWRSICTAYGNAPFFDILAPDLEPYFSKEFTFLVDFNMELTMLVLDWLQVDLLVEKTSAFEETGKNEMDFRFSFSPKDNSKEHLKLRRDLSILDLILQNGTLSWDLITT